MTKPIGKRIIDPFGPRFRNQEDALKFMEHIKNGTRSDGTLTIDPFIIDGEGSERRSKINPEYQNAPFELQLFYGDGVAEGMINPCKT